MSKSHWPKEVPILSADDICKGAMTGPHHTHCLYGWQLRNFPGDLDVASSKALTQAVKEAQPDEPSPNCYISWQDIPKTPKTLIARVWNRAMAILGYTVGNPETKPLTPKAKKSRPRSHR